MSGPKISTHCAPAQYPPVGFCCEYLGSGCSIMNMQIVARHSTWWHAGLPHSPSAVIYSLTSMIITFLPCYRIPGTPDHQICYLRIKS